MRVSTFKQWRLAWAAQVRPVDVATLAEEKARAAVQAELSMFEADRTVWQNAFCYLLQTVCRLFALDCMLACTAEHSPILAWLHMQCTSRTVALPRKHAHTAASCPLLAHLCVACGPYDAGL